jgi:hypothetical protein
MVIETCDRVYTVVQHGNTGRYQDIYVGRNNENHELYTIIRIKDKQVTNQIIEFISEQKNNKKFVDLVEYFAYKGELHIVFSYMEGMSLEKRLQQNCSLDERMEIGKKLLEKMVLYQLPFYFQCQCMKMENIIVTDALDVGFQYTLENVEEYSSYTWQMASAYLYRILKSLFAKELKKNVLEPMKEFIGRIQKDEKGDYLKIYREYCSVCEEVREIPEEELQIPKNWLFRCWTKIKSVRGIIKGTMMTLIFLCVFGYMVYSIYRSFQIKGYKQHFESIGTVQMENDEPEDETE